MEFKEFIKKTMLEYFFITTCITLAIAVIGIILDPGATFGYEAFFAPLIYGLVSLIPAIINYSGKKISLKQIVLRKIFHFICIEILLVSILRYGGLLQEIRELIIFSISVFLVYIAVNILSWYFTKRSAIQINEGLRLLQGKENNNT